MVLPYKKMRAGHHELFIRKYQLLPTEFCEPGFKINDPLIALWLNSIFFNLSGLKRGSLLDQKNIRIVGEQRRNGK